MRKAWGVALLAAFVVACGDDNKPVPGYSHPCDTPFSGSLDCPPAPPPSRQEIPPETVCSRLVGCAILATDRMVKVNNSFVHSLDFRWCIGRFVAGTSHACNTGTRMTYEQVQSAARCIMATPCESLGLPLGQKIKPAASRPKMDSFRCANDTTIWTATVCDHGLLRY
jgi:hypothetical protein